MECLPFKKRCNLWKVKEPDQFGDFSLTGVADWGLLWRENGVRNGRSEEWRRKIGDWRSVAEQMKQVAE